MRRYWRRLAWLVGLLVVVFCLIAAVFVGVPQAWYTSRFADYPEGWLDVRPGMTSDDARALIGEPTYDGENLKLLDRWEAAEGGVDFYLDLWFENGSFPDAEIERVCRWKSFMSTPVETEVLELPSDTLR